MDRFGLIDVQGMATAMDRGGTVTDAGTIFAADAVIVNGRAALIRNCGPIIATAITSHSKTGTLTNSGSIPPS